MADLSDSLHSERPPVAPPVELNPYLHLVKCKQNYRNSVAHYHKNIKRMKGLHWRSYSQQATATWLQLKPIFLISRSLNLAIPLLSGKSTCNYSMNVNACSVHEETFLRAHDINSHLKHREVVYLLWWMNSSMALWHFILVCQTSTFPLCLWWAVPL